MEREKSVLKEIAQQYDFEITNLIRNGDKNMRGFKSKILLAFSIISILTSCSKNNDVNLNNVQLDGASIGDSIEKINSEKYHLSDRYLEDDNTVSFEEWRISLSEDRTIIKIYAEVYDQIELDINGISCSSIEDVMSILGNVESETYDQKQQLEQAIYHDKSDEIKASFVYNITDGVLVYVIIEEGYE